MIRGVVDYHADLVGRDVREDELPLHQIVTGHGATRNVGPRRAGPVLHIEVSDSVSAERRMSFTVLPLLKSFFNV